MTDNHTCPGCESDNSKFNARNTDPTPNWPDNTQLLECRDCSRKWAVVNGVKRT